MSAISQAVDHRVEERFRASTWQATLPIVVSLAGLLVLMLIVFVRQTALDPDHLWHADYALFWYTSGAPSQVIPHIGYHVLLMGLQALLPQAQMRDMGTVVMVAANLVTAVIAYRLILWAVPPRRPRDYWVAAGAAFVVLFISPIILFRWLELDDVYLGFIAPTVYHNPTNILLKPLALAQFWLVVRGLTERHHSLWMLAALLLISVAALFVKPSYAIALVPAVVVYAAWRIYRRQPWDWKLILLGLLIPNIVVLYFQLEILNSERGGFVFAPLFAVSILSGSRPWGVAARFLSSVAFPMLVGLVYLRPLLRAPLVVFSWLVLGVAAAQMYLFSEMATNTAGNFFWGAQLALLIVFLTSIILFWQQIRELPAARLVMLIRQPWVALLLGLLALHIVSGLVWWGLNWLPSDEALRIHVWW